MALQVARTKVWAASMQDRPGGLAEKLEPLAKAGANLEFVIARRDWYTLNRNRQHGPKKGREAVADRAIRPDNRRTPCQVFPQTAGGLRPREPLDALTRGGPGAPLRSRGSLAQLVRERSRGGPWSRHSAFSSACCGPR